MATITGSIGKDTITLAIASAGVTGGPSTDLKDTIFGFNGNDLIEGGGGNDALIGDLKQLTNEDGKAGADLIRGQDGDDQILGDAGLLSGAGLRGGNDRLEGDEGADSLYGDGFTISDGAVGGNDLLDGGDGNDLLVGDAEEIALGSGCGADTLIGGDGDDQLFGDRQIDLADPPILLELDLLKAGKDKLFGGDGDDILFGGGLADQLSGGDGEDLFIFLPGGGKDNLLDFVSGEDRLDIDGYELDFAALDDNQDGVVDDADGFAKQIGAKLILDLGGASGEAAKVDTITLLGVTELVAADFA